MGYSTEQKHLQAQLLARKAELMRKHYLLRLFISGASQRSMRAIEIIKAICEEFLSHRYSLEVIDIYQQPELARDEQIVAAPTLLRKSPSPRRLMIGDMSNRQKLIEGLGLRETDSKEHQAGAV